MTALATIAAVAALPGRRPARADVGRPGRRPGCAPRLPAGLGSRSPSPCRPSLAAGDGEVDVSWTRRRAPGRVSVRVSVRAGGRVRQGWAQVELRQARRRCWSRRRPLAAGAAVAAGDLTPRRARRRSAGDVAPAALLGASVLRAAGGRPAGQRATTWRCRRRWRRGTQVAGRGPARRAPVAAQRRARAPARVGRARPARASPAPAWSEGRLGDATTLVVEEKRHEARRRSRPRPPSRWPAARPTSRPTSRSSATSMRATTTARPVPRGGSLYATARPACSRTRRAAASATSCVIRIDEEDSATRDDRHQARPQDARPSTAVPAALGLLAALQQSTPDVDPAKLFASTTTRSSPAAGAVQRKGQVTATLPVRVRAGAAERRPVRRGHQGRDGRRRGEAHLHLPASSAAIDIAEDDRCRRRASPTPRSSTPAAATSATRSAAAGCRAVLSKCGRSEEVAHARPFVIRPRPRAARGATTAPPRTGSRTSTTSRASATNHLIGVRPGGRARRHRRRRALAGVKAR